MDIFSQQRILITFVYLIVFCNNSFMKLFCLIGIVYMERFNISEKFPDISTLKTCFMIRKQCTI